MPDNARETFNDHPIYSLSEIAMSIHRVVERTYPQPYYIKAEILKLNFYPYSGHCYPELVEKEGNAIKTEMRAIIWSSNYQRINQRFEQITGEKLKEDIRILCLASVEFSPKHGLALHIQDIEPSYTLGEMVRNKMAVIERLKKENVFAQNKSLAMPLVPKRIAVISVETSKGYSDFMTTLESNRYGYRFETELFPSILQGDKAITGMTARLSEIEMRSKEFDCVAIVRGGGGDVGLSCYDDYQLAHRVATFPLPVLTGIGHSTNQTVTDMVAYSFNITPTDVAFSLIERFHDFDTKVQLLFESIARRTAEVIAQEKRRLLEMDAARRIAAPRIVAEHKRQLRDFAQQVTLKSREMLLTQGNALSKLWEELVRLDAERMEQERDQLDRAAQKLATLGSQLLQNRKERVATLEDKVRLLHPDNILKRGFSITRLQGRAVTGAEALRAGDRIVTQLYEGEVTSVVES
ncbi:MAG: exodeoxyribonuclease VII large subunit [Bacteroidales bacterium]|nr:exodeoxyribonuclease VII large subunit [Bacteroidales bacterium]